MGHLPIAARDTRTWMLTVRCGPGLMRVSVPCGSQHLADLGTKRVSSASHVRLMLKPGSCHTRLMPHPTQGAIGSETKLRMRARVCTPHPFGAMVRFQKGARLH
ncbi:hypothetical protein L6452_05125 [Arctium lappa]|uniref:Uncharacterized protein n=1 Tax=Arctium lappa TaxID=4217 RepID=A0ACB9EF34_ARCLA|nr:hypothetical protein L6452_05125 [Arctium lappa]